MAAPRQFFEQAFGAIRAFVVSDDYLAPLSAKARAVAAPIPLLPPVITATFPMQR